jgi:LuxR family transcriptional regulator, maltose regulon positive regulatory protein
VPRLPGNFVPRDLLRRRLDRLATEFPVTLLCAPAGYGKTLLLADWVERTGPANKAWVSLDAGDNDAGRFWTAVLTAVRTCAVVPADNRLRHLPPPETADATGFFAEVIDGFAALPAPVYLILDDLHEISGDETWHGIATLERHQPSMVRFVLATRADPPLPLARLRVQGELAEFRANELRFTHDQAAELLRRDDVELEPDQVRRLVDQTGGWPGGLRLAARSLRAEPDHEAFLSEFASNDRAIADFLVSEVLARLPAAAADVLALVSVCDEVTPALAVALTGRTDAGEILVQLEREGALVLGVGPDRQWLRMHPLLRAYLRADLARQRPGVVAELHAAAAFWYAAEELLGKAIDHVTLADDDRPLAELLRRHAATVLLAGDHDGVRRALDKLGPDAVAGSPSLALISVLAHTEAGERRHANVDLARAWAAWPAHPDPQLARLGQLVLATRALIRGHRPPVARVGWHDVIAALAGTELEAWARLGHGWTRECAGERAAARGEFEAAERIASEHGLDYVAMHCRSALGVLAGQDGDITAMATTCASAVEIADAHGWRTSLWVAADHLAIGFARLLDLHPAAAVDEARHATAALGTDGPVNMLHYLIDALTGAAYADLDRQQEGLALLQRARHDYARVGVPVSLQVMGALAELRCTLDLGHNTLAQQLVAWTRERAGDVAELRLMQAWLAAARHDFYATELAVRTVFDRAPLCPTTLLEARLLEIALELRRGRRTRAREKLGAALALAEPASLVRPFRHADVSVRRLLLEQVGGFGRTNDFAARVGHVMSTTDILSPAVLTNREHAVLARLSSPWSLDELAGDLSVSVNTVKTHVRAIYAKLGVNNRRAAVVAGRQLGLN